MPPTMKPGPKPATKVTGKPAATIAAKAGGLVLPTVKTQPKTSPKDYIYLFYGPPGVGKTTFVNRFSDRVLFCSTDRGTRFMSALRVECLTWAAWDAVLTKLENGPPDQYDFLAIDHVDDWANMAEEHVLDKLKIQALTDAGYGKGWSLLKKELHKFIARVKRLKMGIVFIAHEDSKTIKVMGKDVDHHKPLMSKQAWNAIVPITDLVGYCTMMPMKQGDKRVEIRVLQTIPRQELYAKDRLSHIRKRPAGEWELLDGPKFMATFSN